MAFVDVMPLKLQTPCHMSRRIRAPFKFHFHQEEPKAASLKTIISASPEFAVRHNSSTEAAEISIASLTKPEAIDLHA